MLCSDAETLFCQKLEQESVKLKGWVEIVEYSPSLVNEKFHCLKLWTFWNLQNRSYWTFLNFWNSWIFRCVDQPEWSEISPHCFSSTPSGENFIIRPLQYLQGSKQTDGQRGSWQKRAAQQWKTAIKTGRETDEQSVCFSWGRQTDRQRAGQTDREPHRQTDKQTDNKKRQTNRQTNR